MNDTAKIATQIIIEDVKKFWEKNPLFTGESKFRLGDKEFFEEHKKVVIQDCCAGRFNDEFFIPRGLSKDARILDLGCGVGFWPVEFIMRGYKNVFAADLTQAALEITKRRLDEYGFKADLSLQYAEGMTYANNSFDHVNCQGVIHHSPDIEASIREIARVLKQGGTACISVYYKNALLNVWPMLSVFGNILYRLGFRLKGRGRESILLVRNTDDIVKMYDGKDNPWGRAYTKAQIVAMVEPYFSIHRIFLSFFPARAMPFNIPPFLHRFLARNFGFMINVHLRKN